MVNINLKQEKFNRNIDYFLGIMWFSLGIYLLFREYQFLSAFYLCLGIFVAHNALMHYQFMELAKISDETFKMLKDLNQPRYDEYESKDL